MKKLFWKMYVIFCIGYFLIGITHFLVLKYVKAQIVKKAISNFPKKIDLNIEKNKKDFNEYMQKWRAGEVK